ncbi:hypothetical protein RHO15_00140 [Utexia brackfieldae]|uniref:hypothetical protein n=1 Tax=Utexia brackfieldae TaxID=3074108 RepID=UPI00370DDAC9
MTVKNDRRKWPENIPHYSLKATLSPFSRSLLCPATILSNAYFKQYLPQVALPVSQIDLV